MQIEKIFLDGNIVGKNRSGQVSIRNLQSWLVQEMIYEIYLLHKFVVLHRGEEEEEAYNLYFCV